MAPTGNEVECEVEASAESTNDQEGDNAADLTQAADASTGDGVGGQVIGVVSVGDTSIDATNESREIDASTGDADANNTAELDVGQLADAAGGFGLILNICGDDDPTCDIDLEADATNFMDGDIDSDLSQTANAASGDAVGGQVVGAVAPAGGSADLVVANTSEGVDLDSGSADQDNSDTEFVGQQSFGEADLILLGL